MDTEQNIIIYNTADGKTSVALYARDSMVWMSQKQIAELFDTSKQNVSQHIISIIDDNELQEKSVVKEYLTTASDGKEYTVTYYSLEMVLAIGFRVRSKRGVQFRKWANEHLKVYLEKGFLIDSERLKNPDGRPDYFDELLERIRDIRSSEKRFYQKVRDLFALSSDYDTSDKSTQMFFAETQNKLIYAVTHFTAAELILERADADKKNMSLTSWKGTVVRKQDIFVAKNYLSEDELDSLSRLVTIFLESAEMRAKNRMDITMKFWRENVDRMLEFSDKNILSGPGKVSQEEMSKKVSEIYGQFNERRKAFQAKEADLVDLKEIEAEIKSVDH